MPHRHRAPWLTAAFLALLGPSALAQEPVPDAYDPYGSDTLVDEIEADTARQLEEQRRQREEQARQRQTTEPDTGDSSLTPRPDPLDPDPLDADPLDADPLDSDRLVPDPLESDPLAPDPIAPDPTP